MGVQIAWVSLVICLYCLKDISVTATRNISVGHFKVSRHSHAKTQCSGNVLTKYVLNNNRKVLKTYDLFGAFTNGKRIDVYATFPESEWDIFNYPRKELIIHTEFSVETYIYPYDEKLPGTRREISFVSNEHKSTQILLDGKHMATLKNSKALFEHFRTMFLTGRFYSPSDPSFFLIHGIKVSGE